MGSWESAELIRASAGAGRAAGSISSHCALSREGPRVAAGRRVASDAMCFDGLKRRAELVFEMCCMFRADAELV